MVDYAPHIEAPQRTADVIQSWYRDIDPLIDVDIY